MRKIKRAPPREKENRREGGETNGKRKRKQDRKRN